MSALRYLKGSPRATLQTQLRRSQGSRAWDGKDLPRVQAREVSGPTIDEWLARALVVAGQSTRAWVQVSFELTLDGCTSFWRRFVPQLGELGGPDDVRIVFSFSG